jgi:hypothetical protein
MSKSIRGSLGSFVAAKTAAMPAPLEAEPIKPPANHNPEPPKVAAAEPIPKPAAAPKVEIPAPDEMVTLNMRVPASFRRELKLYAVTIGKDMSEVVREGIELHRQKYSKAKG